MTRLTSVLVCWCCLLPSSTLAFQLDTKIRVKSTKSIQVLDLPLDSATATPNSSSSSRNIGLESYMTLPVEQYVLVPMPMNAKLSRNEDEFLLTVPPLKFLSLQVQPLVTAQVVLGPNQVTITSSYCRLASPESSYIESVQLNERFRFQANCTLTWDAHQIFADTQIDVDVDPPGPFDKLPQKALQATGNTAMQLSMNFIIKSFLKGLAQDYQQWSQDAEYRQKRQSLSARLENEKN